MTDYDFDCLTIRDVNHNHRFDAGIDVMIRKHAQKGTASPFLGANAPEVLALKEYFDITSLDGLLLPKAERYLRYLHLAEKYIPQGVDSEIAHNVFCAARMSAQEAGIHFDAVLTEKIWNRRNDVYLFRAEEERLGEEVEFSPTFFWPSPTILNSESVVIGKGKGRLILRGSKAHRENIFYVEPAQLRSIGFELNRSLTPTERAHFVLYSPTGQFFVRQGRLPVERRSAIYFPFVPLGEYELCLSRRIDEGKFKFECRQKVVAK